MLVATDPKAFNLTSTYVKSNVFTFRVLPFWCRLTRIVPDRIQEGPVKRLCVCVWVLAWLFVWSEV